MKRFVVGTGRCGSTLLSRMLAQHPDLLSLFEFFNGLDGSRRFSTETITGEEFWKLISQPHPFITMITSRGYPVEEITYPFRSTDQFSRDDDIPWILVTTLGRLSDDPDTLLAETENFSRRRPPQTLQRHYTDLFDWLTVISGKRIWNERSGSSIDYIAGLAATFPDARFVHIHRAGEEAALSMREHHAFRLAISLVHSLHPEVDIATAVTHRIPPAGAPDPLRKILDSRPDASYFGKFWNEQVRQGHRQLEFVAPGQYMEIRFEDLVTSPQRTLQQLAEFFELPDADWIDNSAALVRAMPAARLGELPKDERDRLVEACRTGNQLLGRQ